MKIKNYHTSLRNRKSFKKMGGVATAVQNYLKTHTVKVMEGEEDDEFMITRLDHINPPLNIVNIYGGIETRMENQEILESWGRIKLELDKIRDRNEFCLLVGDVNRAIGSGSFGIKGNRPRVSYGGKLLIELLETGEYILGNSNHKVEGGPWTWVSRADSRVRSCIDLVIMSADLAPYLKRIKIDNKQEFAPARVRMVDGRKKLIFSDHYPLVIEFENLPKGWIRKDKVSSWNLSKPSGWEKYKVLTEAAAGKMNKVIENEDETNEEVAANIEKIETKIKFQSFGKTKPPTKQKISRRLEEQAAVAGQMDSEDRKASKLYKDQCQEIEDDINKLKALKFGRVTNVFKMAEIVGGTKKQKGEAHAIIDPKTNEIVVNTEEIKRISLEHCVKVLQNNPTEPEAELYVKLESELHEVLMADETDKDTNINKEDFDKVVQKFKQKKKPTYQFLTKAGDSYQESIYRLCSRMIRDEDFPKIFSETLLKQLWKRKGRREVLDHHRFLHLRKDWKSRLTETLVTGMMKEDIIQAGTKFQIGGIPGHRIEEHLIVLKSLIMRRISVGKGVVIQLVDYEKFFDSERLRTVMASLNKANVNKKAYRCWFKLNKTTVISVETPVGRTEKAEVHEIVPQGSGGAALASGLDLALGLESYFSGSSDEICYGKVRSQPQAWQDDILRIAEDINSTRVGNAKLAAMTMEKGLKAHKKKTTYVIIGTKKYREEMEREAEINPVSFGNMTIQPSGSEVYLGEVIHSLGLEAGVEATIDSRMGKVRGAMYKTKALMEDFRLQAVGGMEGAWIIWECSILQTLLSGCGSWIGIGKKVYDKLDEIQNEYLRMMYSCPPSTPKPALRSQSGMLDMKHRIWLEKVCVVARILHLKEEQENYAREVLREQLDEGWEGLTREVDEICQLAGLSNVCHQFLGRKEVEEAMVNHHLKEIRKEMEPLSKMTKIKVTDTRQMQPYMKQKSLQNSRTEFLWETNMLDTRMNMKGKYKKDEYQCPHCLEGRQPGGSLETSDHLLVCSAYTDLREGKDPELVLEDRASYLRQVVLRRSKLEKQLRPRQTR